MPNLFICGRCKKEIPQLELHLCGDKVLQKQRNEEILRLLRVIVGEIKHLKKITSVGPAE